MIAPHRLIGQSLRRGLQFQGRATRVEFICYLIMLIPVVIVFFWAMRASELPQDQIRWIRIGALLLLIPYIALQVRRCHDAGLSGLWSLLGAIPFVGTVLLVFLMLRKSSASGARFEAEGRGRISYRLAGALLVILFGLGAIYRPYWIPAESMSPTLRIGDYLVVNQWALGADGPERGDIVVFRHPAQDFDFIKRVIGLPGDMVQMQGGLLYLNDTPVDLQQIEDFTQPYARRGPAAQLPRCGNEPLSEGEICEIARFIETLPTGRSYRVLDLDDGPLDDTPVFTVPEGHIFVLGDNRDNSADSRVSRSAGGIGLVPLDNIIGRADWLIFSSRGARIGYFWTWDPERYLQALQ